MREHHLNELSKSCINDEIISLNFKSLQANSWEYLLYALDDSTRRNDGRLKDYWLKKYAHLDNGGWWASGIDLTTMQPSEWGCFKPDRPRIEKGKPIKYEHPPQAETGVFAFNISPQLFSQISHKPIEECEKLNFWQWVIDNPVPIIITEGAKKAACLLSCGYVALALPGISNGIRNDIIIPELQVLSKIARNWIIAFDEDVKWLIQNNVTLATTKLGNYLIRFNESCEVFVMKWEPEEGKGIDDLVARHGEGRLAEVYSERLDFETFVEKYGEVKSFYKNKPGLLKFISKTLGKQLAFNQLKNCIEIDGDPLELDDALAFRFIEQFNVDAPKDALIGCLLHEARKNTYNPVRRYLEECAKAKLEPIRIDNLSTRYFGTTDPIYDFMVQQWLIGAVARAFEPGCKMQFALLLQSKAKGVGKSTFFEVLGGKWYNNSLPARIKENKDFLTLASSWIHEWAEFDKVTSKNEASVVKSFVTCAVDSYVPPYGKKTEDNPRQSVFCGTVNETEFLNDPEGERRFLIIPVNPNIRLIDNVQLSKERDQIWAAATQAYIEGKKQGRDAWAIPREIEQQIIELSKGYTITTDDEAVIEDYLADKDSTSVAEIMSELFKMDVTPNKENRQTQNNIGKTLKRLGWQKTNKLQAFTELKRGSYIYVRPESQQSQPDHSSENCCDPVVIPPEPLAEAVCGDNHINDGSPENHSFEKTVIKTVISENLHQDSLSDNESQHHTKNSQEKNFYESPECTKSVSSDRTEEDMSDQDRENWQVGDRLKHQITQKMGVISWLKPDRTQCRVIFDGTDQESQCLFTRLFRRLRL